MKKKIFCTHLTEEHNIPAPPNRPFGLVSKNWQSIAIEQMFKDKNQATQYHAQAK
jgi:hypothetical protein